MVFSPKYILLILYDMNFKHIVSKRHTYLLLTEFEGRAVSYGPSFFPPRFIKSKGKKRGSVAYSTVRENEVSKIFIISLVCV